jgi:Mn2+/Fe2+ NRAMP family transporter
MKAVIIIALLLVLAALGSAGVFMLRKDDQSEGARDKKMARALAVRVALSVALFLFILLSWHMGWIEPRGIPLPQR